MTAERYAALHDDDRSYVVDRSQETAPGVHPIIREWPPRQWEAANEYARVRNAIDNPPARWSSLYPGYRPEIMPTDPAYPGSCAEYRAQLDAAVADYNRRHPRP